jgi:hypothetical protein
VHAIVLAGRHAVYLDMDPDRVARRIGWSFALKDCLLFLDVRWIRSHLELECEVNGVGRGHLVPIKESLRK